MRYLGIDYGSKRVGIALSDDGGSLAFPREILENDKKLIEKIKKICAEEEIRAIVIGVSYNEKGEANRIMEKIEPFKIILEKETGLKVFEEKEFFTSSEARKIPGKIIGRASRKPESGRSVDDKAAALILQRFLDKNKFSKYS